MNARYKIVLEFETPNKALEWFDAAKATGSVPADSDLFKADALTLERGGDARTFIIRSGSSSIGPRVRHVYGDTYEERL